jgi:hypothetical protein
MFQARKHDLSACDQQKQFCAWMTCDIFASWFENDFVSSVGRHLRSKKLEEKSL